MKKPMQLIRRADSRKFLDRLPEASFHAVVTDPPYELGFMGRKWDKSGVSYDPEFWAKCLRVLKPGGYLLSFGGTRTAHRIACAIEDAGFEIRDTVMWVYGSGFPKSVDIGKAIDKKLGKKREVIGRCAGATNIGRRTDGKKGYAPGTTYPKVDTAVDVTAPASDEARQWDGWGSGLKPAYEPVIVARKPLDGTLSENVLEHGAGGMNLDASRIGSEKFHRPEVPPKYTVVGYGNYPTGVPARTVEGRWPANLILDEMAAELLDEQSGITSSSPVTGKIGELLDPLGRWGTRRAAGGFSDSGGASRFFYVVKASRGERELGLDDLKPVRREDVTGREPDSAGQNNPRTSTRRRGEIRNPHPTRKPLELMRYLVKLVTPPGGRVLDPFCGTGTTITACKVEGFSALGIDRSKKYVRIAREALKVKTPRHLMKPADAHRGEHQDRRVKKGLDFDSELL